MKNVNLLSYGWEDYSLLDSGDGRKLEKFGKFVVIRPEPQAIWKPKEEKLWETADAEFLFQNGVGRWVKNSLPDEWSIKLGRFEIFLKTNLFKHIGIFPEQFPNWLWSSERTALISKPKILNLFGYTGVINLFLAQKGASVVHIDSSLQSNKWALKNIQHAGCSSSVKVLLDDALKFSKRELRRGNFYNGIILDPPAFGRGPKGEVWKIERDLSLLLDVIKKILKKEGNSFLILNSYAAGYSPFSLKQMVESHFATFKYEGEFGELQIKELNSERVLSSGIYVRFVLK